MISRTFPQEAIGYSLGLVALRALGRAAETEAVLAAAIGRFPDEGRLIVDRAKRSVALELKDGTRHTTSATKPDDYEAADYATVVLHLDPRHKSLLADLLGRHAHLVVKEAVNGARIEPSTVYIAQPDTHLLVADTHLSLTSSELVHFSRPSVDLLFESVAAAYRDRAIGVILTGSGLDGATGIRAIKERGGTTMVQDPSEASHPSMPSHAYATGCVDFKLPLDDIGPALARLVLATTAAAGGV